MILKEILAIMLRVKEMNHICTNLEIEMVQRFQIKMVQSMKVNINWDKSMGKAHVYGRMDQLIQVIGSTMK
jgi:hypothetical protein